MRRKDQRRIGLAAFVDEAYSASMVSLERWGGIYLGYLLGQRVADDATYIDAIEHCQSIGLLPPDAPIYAHGPLEEQDAEAPSPEELAAIGRRRAIVYEAKRAKEARTGDPVLSVAELDALFSPHTGTEAVA